MSTDLPPSSPSPLDAAAADAAVAQAADSTGHAHGPVHTHCENCGTKLAGPFCHRCGQHDFDVHRSFGHAFLEALENLFHFDGKFFRNIVTLLFSPGRLTAEFNAGKRASQVPPFRLYIFVSVLFFFISFLGRDERGLDTARAEVDQRSKALQEEIAKGVDAAATKFASGENSQKLHELAEEMRKAPGVPQKLDPAAPSRVAVAPGWNVSLQEGDSNAFERFMTERGRHALQDPRVFRDSFLHAIPKMLLFCLPIFALYTRVLFRRSGQLYLQHLIIALHFHTFIFLFLLARSGWSGLADFAHLGGVVKFVTALWLIAYPALMLRRIFGQSWIRTIVKTFALCVAYFTTLVVAFLVTIALVFMNL